MGKSRRQPQTPGPSEACPSPPQPGIRDFFQPQSGTPAAPEKSKMAAAPPSAAPCSPASSGSGWDQPPDLSQLLRSLPTREDLNVVAKDLRLSLSGEIQQVRQDLQGLTQRLVVVEEGQQAQKSTLQAHSTQLSLHHHLLHALTRQVEDLENRGRRHNIRVRGLPESEKDSEELRCMLTRLFNMLLHNAHEAPIEMERWHRALRPKGPPGAPPRDIICCITRFGMKERIMEQARGKTAIRFEGTKVELYQDISQLTLHTRRVLRPLTAALQRGGLQYRWLYPSGIQVRTPHGPVTVRNNEELPNFLTLLELPPDIISAWPDPIQFYTADL
uniref:Uncharacterized protein n=1 Tax=Leptobrachium leishanense TaxID=445787 RepID=A0A8C5PG62_9ANUR